jgi:hypothetical protein
LSEANRIGGEEICLRLRRIEQAVTWRGVLSVSLRNEGRPTYFWEESPEIRRTEVRPQTVVAS